MEFMTSQYIKNVLVPQFLLSKRMEWFPTSIGTLNTTWSSWKEVAFNRPFWSWQSREALTDFSQQHFFPSVNYTSLLLTIKVSRSLKSTIFKNVYYSHHQAPPNDWNLGPNFPHSKNIKFTKVEETLAWKTQLWIFEGLSSPPERSGPWTHTGTQVDLWRNALWGSMDRGERGIQGFER